MHLDDYVEQVHSQLRAAAALADERAQQVAGALADTAAPSIRLAILGALGQAADEITAALLDAPGAPNVAVRIDGSDVRIDVSSTEPGLDAPPPERPEDEASARISLRLPESLKADVERAAVHEGISVNSWLVRAAGIALRHGQRFGPGGPFGPGSPFDTFGSGRPDGPGHAQRITGWING